MKPRFDRIATIITTVCCLNGGASFAQIAEKAQCTASTLRRWVRNAGFTKRNGEWKVRF